jgi:hypothetical protein
LVTALSGRVGPAWSGLLAVFPLLGIILSVSSHRAHGSEFVISLLRGMVLGRFSFAAFCLSLSFALLHQEPALAFLESAALAMLVQWCTRRILATPRLQIQPITAAPDEVSTPREVS